MSRHHKISANSHAANRHWRPKQVLDATREHFLFLVNLYSSQSQLSTHLTPSMPEKLFHILLTVVIQGKVLMNLAPSRHQTHQNLSLNYNSHTFQLRGNVVCWEAIYSTSVAGKGLMCKKSGTVTFSHKSMGAILLKMGVGWVINSESTYLQTIFTTRLSFLYENVQESLEVITMSISHFAPTLT